jgi:hypothetical protein
MTERTPGPWELWTSCSWRRFGSRTTGETVCEPIVHHRDRMPDLYFRNGGQDGPDARCLAAAPDLEEACIALIAASHEIPPGPSDLRTALDLAIRATDHLMGPLAEGRTDV